MCVEESNPGQLKAMKVSQSFIMVMLVLNILTKTFIGQETCVIDFVVRGCITSFQANILRINQSRISIILAK